MIEKKTIKKTFKYFKNNKYDFIVILFNSDKIISTDFNLFSCTVKIKKFVIIDISNT